MHVKTLFWIDLLKIWYLLGLDKDVVDSIVAFITIICCLYEMPEIVILFLISNALVVTTLKRVHETFQFTSTN